MINLEHIKKEKCPRCGAVIVSETKEKQHTNGHWNEYRKFQCGHQLHFSPNFMRVKEVGFCLNDPEIKNMFDKRKIAMEKLEEYIKRLDVDEQWKAQINYSIIV